MARTSKRPPRQGRGRLHTIDMLPEEADADIVWLSGELRDGKRLQIDLLAEFNSRLADRAIGPISKSAFSRYTVRKAMAFRELDAARRMSAELAQVMGTDSADKTTIALTEIAKMRALKMYEEGDLTSSDILNLARAGQAASSAQKISFELRLNIEKETLGKAAKAAVSAGRRNGVSEDAIRAIERDILKIAQ